MGWMDLGETVSLDDKVSVAGEESEEYVDERVVCLLNTEAAVLDAIGQPSGRCSDSRDGEGRGKGHLAVRLRRGVSASLSLANETDDAWLYNYDVLRNICGLVCLSWSCSFAKDHDYFVGETGFLVAGARLEGRIYLVVAAALRFIEFAWFF